MVCGAARLRFGRLSRRIVGERASEPLSIYRLDVYWWSDGVDVYIITTSGVGLAVSPIDICCYEVVDGVIQWFEHNRVESVFGAHGGELECLLLVQVCFEFADHGVWAIVVAAHFFDNSVGDGFWGAVVEIV